MVRVVPIEQLIFFSIEDLIMANYINYWRSNRFQVKDVDTFLKDIEGVECEVTNNGDSIVLSCSDSGTNWLYYYDEESEDYIYPVWSEIAENNLIEGEVLVFMEIGFEKLRYFVGHAEAYSWKGEKVKCTLDDIYKLAEAKFGVNDINLCEY